MLRSSLGAFAALALSDRSLLAAPLGWGAPGEPSAEDAARLAAWVGTLRGDGLAAAGVPLGRAAVRVGELALGSPYVAGTLDAYLKAGGSPVEREPLTLSLSHFDCVCLVESCLGVARLAHRAGPPTWEGFGREVERMRYRGGERGSYASRLHYFSEWMLDNERRGLVRRLGKELGGERDARPLRFMTSHASAYPALSDPTTLTAIGAMERRLDDEPRWVVKTAHIAAVEDRLQTGDVLGFATDIPGLDVSHSALVYRDADGVARVLHAPLSGGEVQISRGTLPEYVAGIRHSTGVLVARPLLG
ncbi:MAG TPA: N-acetylmuramoyl-L-alanine amidase-like domain-containing protein [Longimicrobiaceae bacterium]|nr:N-acetylmuramoyl-L-alanine amidase-like domain-containing protein [Longimicrobiaceae bacterium]